MITGCPDPETLAAYLDGQLLAAQRERTEEHLAGCDACTTNVADALRFLRSARSERLPHRRRAAIAALVLVAAAGFV